MRARARRVRISITAALVATLTIAATSCSDPDQPTDQGPSTSAAVPASPSPTIDPLAQPALDAYRAFNETTNNASREPLSLGSKYPRRADFTRYSFDPLRGEFETYLAGLAQQRISYRGEPPVSNLTVISINPQANPYPLVVLTDCQIGSDWGIYREDGTPVPDASAPVPPPYLVTAKVIFYKGKWGVQSTEADTSRTCSA